MKAYQEQNDMEIADWVAGFTNYDDHEWTFGRPSYDEQSSISSGASLSDYFSVGYDEEDDITMESAASSVADDEDIEVIKPLPIKTEPLPFETAREVVIAREVETALPKKAAKPDESDDDSEDDIPLSRRISRPSGAKTLPKKTSKPAKRSPLLKSASIEKVPVKKAPVMKSAVKKGGSWSDAEHNAIHRCLVTLRQWEQSTGRDRSTWFRDLALWGRISNSLKEVFDIERSGSACKNYWSRYGRLRSGFEERVSPTASLVTSAQGTAHTSAQTFST